MRRLILGSVFAFEGSSCRTSRVNFRGYPQQGNLGAERRWRFAYWEAYWGSMVGQMRWHLMH